MKGPYSKSPIRMCSTEKQLTLITTPLNCSWSRYPSLARSGAHGNNSELSSETHPPPLSSLLTLRYAFSFPISNQPVQGQAFIQQVSTTCDYAPSPPAWVRATCAMRGDPATSSSLPPKSASPSARHQAFLGGKLQMQQAEQLSGGKTGSPARERGYPLTHRQGTSLPQELLLRAFPCRSSDFCLSASSARAFQGEWQPNSLMIWTPISSKTPRTGRNSSLRNRPITCLATSDQQRHPTPPLRPTPASSHA